MTKQRLPWRDQGPLHKPYTSYLLRLAESRETNGCEPLRDIHTDAYWDARRARTETKAFTELKHSKRKLDQ